MKRRDTATFKFFEWHLARSESSGSSELVGFVVLELKQDVASYVSKVFYSTVHGRMYERKDRFHCKESQSVIVLCSLPYTVTTIRSEWSGHQAFGPVRK